MNAIEIRGLSKSFRGMYAVDDLNMTVPVGALFEDAGCFPGQSRGFAPNELGVSAGGFF